MPADEPDPYGVLGVSRTATTKEIRAAYRALAARYHPDRHQGNPLADLATARLAEINRAYETLSDPERRAAADGSGPTAVRRAADDRLMGRRLLRAGGLLLVLPLILRMGARIGRGLLGLLRFAVGELAALRGPRLAAVIAVAALLILFFARRRRR